MKFKFLLVALLFILAGCDQFGESQPQISQAEITGGTAIYLPSGLGIDFGKLPVKDVIAEDQRSKSRDVFFEFSEDNSRLDDELTRIFQSDGYVRRVNSPGNYKSSITYRKPKSGGDSYLVLARYSEFVGRGLEKKVTLRLSWRFDFKSVDI